MRWKIFVERFIEKFNRDQTTTLAASLAFYTALSLAPLLILFLALASVLDESVQKNFVIQLHSLMGPDAAIAVETVMQNAGQRRDLTSIGSFFGLLTLVFSAGLIFGDLRSALNRIFAVEEKQVQDPSYWHLALVYARSRLLNVGLALSFVLTMTASLLVSAVISSEIQSRYQLLMVLMDLGLSFVFYGGLFTFVYHYIPAEKIDWPRAWRGGFLTSLLFVIGKQLISSYLGKSAIGSAYGAAGSIIVLLAWVYYSALITFVGAQISALMKLGHRGLA